jgi:hypothetical protein
MTIDKTKPLALQIYLTPKGLNVRTADKPVLVCVT